MAKNKLKRTISNLFLAVQICCLLISGGLDMAVLCHADDGHVKIEAANAAGCAKSTADHHAENPAANPETKFSAKDDCGDCVDVPLSIGRAVAQKKPYKSNIAISIELAPASNGTADSTANPLPPELVPPPPYFTPLASIVLLI